MHEAHENNDLIPVQVRLTPSDNAKLEATAERLGVHKTTVLRLLVRECGELAVTLTTKGDPK
jgi:hypothetical protein